jgi:hypothetical protein
MKFHPLLFSTPMVQALLDDRKNQTRRTKGLEQVNDNLNIILDIKLITDPEITYALIRTNDGGNYKVDCPYHLGDVLWVRETFREIEQDNGKPRYEFKATETINLSDKWKPSIFMPKTACRIFLKIKSIRIERLQEISERDAKAEGAKDTLKISEFECMKDLGKWIIPRPFSQHQFGFLSIWCQINGCESWLLNPYVWVYEFEKTAKPEDFLE